jgi:type II secretion system protein N
VIHLRQIPARFTPEHPGRIGSILTAIGIGLLMFLLGLILFFPEAALQQRLQYELAKNIPGKVAIGAVSFSLPYGIRGQEITLRMDDRAIPELHFDSLTLTPHLSTLIGKPGACFEAQSGSGQVSGSIQQNGALSLSIDQFRFDAPLKGFTNLRMTGTISDASIETDLRPESDAPSSIDLQASEIILSGTDTLTPGINQIRLGQLTINAEGSGRNLNITRGELSGGDILVNATGSILAGRTARSTRLNLQLDITPSPTLDPSTASLLDLIGSPGKDNGRKLIIRGTLAQPNVR